MTVRRVSVGCPSKISLTRVYSADITYASLAKAFDQPLVHHAETLRRMTELSKHRSWIHTQNQEQRSARQRMALFPANAETLFVARDMWVVSNPSLVFPPPFVPRLFRKWISFFFFGRGSLSLSLSP